MKLATSTTAVKGREYYNSGYYSIHDDGSSVERILYIEDDFGGSVKLNNEQIGELFKHIKPALYG